MRWMGAVAIAAATLLLAACSGGSSAARPASVLGGATQEAGGAVPDGWKTPYVMPVTPVALTFQNTDPSFEALPGARAIFGEYVGGTYEIEVPDAWNGSVVYYAHGFRGNGAELTITPPPLRGYFIDHGFAWAASSFTKNGYEPGAAARDTYALRDVVAEKLGEPKHSYLYGTSMGGHITALSLELYPRAYDGALGECGVVSGHEQLDYLLSWAALAEYISGQTLFANANDTGKLLSTLQNDVGSVLGPPQALTAKGNAFASAIEELTGGPRPFFREGFIVGYVTNFGLLLQAAAQPQISNAVAANAGTVYAIGDGYGFTSDEINGEVSRIAANPMYVDPAAYPENASFSGKIQTPFLTIHGTGDLFVPISLERSYRHIVDGAGSGDLLVQRAIRRAGHCMFSPDERIAAFDDLVSWVEKGQKPAGEDLTGDLSDAGRAFTQPLLDDDPGGLTAP